MPYIDRDKIDFRIPAFKDATDDAFVSIRAVQRCIAMIPEADVEEVVRCNACIYSSYNYFVGTFSCSKLSSFVDKDFYCAYGVTSSEKNT